MECNGEEFVCPVCMSAGDLESTSEVNLSAQLPLSVMSDPPFVWNDTHGTDFVQQISSAYDVAMHWRRNLFLVPFGKMGKVFVGELVKLFTAYGEGGLWNVLLL